jgi:hypothetical protein
MARPRKTKEELRASVIGVRFTAEERRFVIEEADVCGLSFSSFMRKKCLGKRVASAADLKVLAELRRLGGLLKHLHNETRGMYSALTSDCLKEISSYIRKLSKEIDGKAGIRQ